MTLRLPAKLYDCVAVGILLFYAATVAAEVSVESTRIWPSPEKTRLVFDLTDKATYKLFSLSNPQRLVIDIDSARFKDAPDIPLIKTPIEAVRYAKRKNGVLRIVLDMKEKVSSNSFILSPNERYGHRLVIDLFAENPKASDPIQPQMTVAPRIARELVIAIDAGHGGDDPGAIGKRGTYEKDITLAIAKELALLVALEPGMRPVLIREDDYYVSLRDRITKARSVRADLFVSIHADSFKNPHAKGSSVYVLSNKGASSEAARWLARKENSSDLLGGVGEVSLRDKDELLASVLLDLSLTATIDASMLVGDSVLQELREVNRLHKPRVEQAGFVVLKSPDIPSILVETAFLSNAKEEEKLRQKRFQKKMAKAILNGVRNYFVLHPVPGTQFLADIHTVKRGESLSLIAHRYNTSVEILKSWNNLSNDVVIIGQQLKIPEGTS